MEKLNKNYWTERWSNEQTGWDMGHPSPPIAEYIDQLSNKELHILIPGCGNAYEAEHLYSKGFTNFNVLDIAQEPLNKLHSRLPELRNDQLVCSDFFHHEDQYDLIIEQTFFCAIDPVLRSEYVKHAAKLLKPGGKLVGLLWGVEMSIDKPPFGGNHVDYEELVTPYFEIKTMEDAHNSIAPRLGKELFVIFQKPVDSE
jgi:SAM-dependent methyltransferase